MIRTACLRPRTPNPLHIVSAPVVFIQRLTRSIVAIDTWRRRHRSSMQCARVEARILRDLGVSEAQRFIAVNKPFWEK